LYQGTTLVGPQQAQQKQGFSPWASFLASWEKTLHSREFFLDKHFVRDTPLAGAKALISGVVYGPTKVVP